LGTIILYHEYNVAPPAYYTL